VLCGGVAAEVLPVGYCDRGAVPAADGRDELGQGGARGVLVLLDVDLGEGVALAFGEVANQPLR
jgi:hypothetical protein